MQKTLRGLVRDHRLPYDYNHHWNQPWFSRAFLKNFKRFLVVRQMTKQNVTTPIFALFVFAPIMLTSQVLYQYYTTGHFPQALQGNSVLYRKGNYINQHQANANPDNHWDARYYCWSTDPFCGLDVAPKRPWLDLKDPAKSMHKFHRDMDVNVRL